MGGMTSAQANDWDFDVRAGYYASDVDGPFVGAGGLTQWGSSRWYINPNLEWAFGDDVDLITLNGDVHYDFHTDAKNLALWAGAGLALVDADSDLGDNDDTNLGLNLLFGVGATEGNVRPFGQIKLIMYEETELVLMGGLRF
jgi:hypothetical protein